MKPIRLQPDLTRVRPVAGSGTGMIRCGFCVSGSCDQCPGGIEHRGGMIWKCGCTKHPLVLRCLSCGSQDPALVDSEKYHCTDSKACKARATERTESNPAVRHIREIQMATETAEIKAPKARAPKVGYCVHCNEPTKGGKFVAGHDAKWVSEHVVAVMNGQVEEKAARAKLVQMGSDALGNKFDKSLASQRGKAESKRLAKEESEANALAANEAAALDEKRQSLKPEPVLGRVGSEDENGFESEDDEDIELEEDEEDEDGPEPEPAPKPVVRRTRLGGAKTADAKPTVRRRSTAN